MEKLHSRLLFYLFFFISLVANRQLVAQKPIGKYQTQEAKYWVFLKDKVVEGYDYSKHLSGQTIQNRIDFNLPLVQFTDIPLNQAYIGTLQNIGAKTVCQSKWLNAVSAYATDEQLEEIKKLPFVKSVQVISQPILSFSTQNRQKESIISKKEFSKKEYGIALKQMEVEAFTRENLNGKGVVIGVIDAGYYGAKDNQYLAHLFLEDGQPSNRIMGMKDMLNPEATDPYTIQQTSSDDHGTTVLQMITGYTEKGMQYGFANKAKFYLARTDHGDREFRAEEDYWITSMEWMDSLGVRLINTSLGYSSGFDNPKENYKPSQMDGKTSVISKGVQIGADEKGLLIIVAAGNEGSDYSWEVVSAPADAKGALSVGAVDRSGLKSSYSSVGVESLSYTKPNVSCVVQLFAGTSFSAPVVTGFAACLMQKYPKTSSKEIFAAIEQSALLYPYTNNYVGYGVPRASIALKVLSGNNKTLFKDKKEVKVKGLAYLLSQTKKTDDRVVVFHKKNATIVLDQDYISAKKGKYKIIKKRNAKRSTVVYQNMLIEIIWE